MYKKRRINSEKTQINHESIVINNKNNSNAMKNIDELALDVTLNVLKNSFFEYVFPRKCSYFNKYI